MLLAESTILTKEHLISGKCFLFIDKYKAATMVKIIIPKNADVLGNMLFINGKHVGIVEEITNHSFTYAIPLFNKMITGRVMFTDCRIKD